MVNLMQCQSHQPSHFIEMVLRCLGLSLCSLCTWYNAHELSILLQHGDQTDLDVCECGSYFDVDQNGVTIHPVALPTV
eukprot:m.31792 g.31792  ORF g.31792 m.31792 type:complete len:78 (+) comp9459_c0_seq2:1523-1756(+)